MISKENCNLIHVKAELIKKTLCIDAAEISKEDLERDLTSGVHYYKAIVWNFEGISLPAIIQSLRCCPFLKFLVCPDLEREVGKHYIRELVYVLGFTRGLHVIYKDDMVALSKHIPTLSNDLRLKEDAGCNSDDLGRCNSEEGLSETGRVGRGRNGDETGEPKAKTKNKCRGGYETAPT